MLKSRRICQLSTPGISALLQLTDSDRLIIAKYNGDVEVYSQQSNNFKLFQTYSKLFKNLSNKNVDDEMSNVVIKQLLHSDILATIFAVTDHYMVLLNSSNLHIYDKIFDKRGFDLVWLKNFSKLSSESYNGLENTNNFNTINTMSNKNDNKNKASMMKETPSGSDVDEEQKKKNTYLIYTMNGINDNLRVLYWKGRTYKNMFTITLPLAKRSEKVTSLEVTNNGDIVVITDKNGFYLWTKATKSVIKLNKFYQNKYPNDMVQALIDLKTNVNNLVENEKIDPNLQNAKNIQLENNSMFSDNTVKTKKSIFNLWKDDKNTIKKNSNSSNVKIIFKTDKNTIHNASNDISKDKYESDISDIMILDGFHEKLFRLNPDNSIQTIDHKQFFSWNEKFKNMEWFTSNLLLVYNEFELKFVDWENGFTFLQKTINSGIHKIVKLDSINFLVWTKNDEIILFEYKVNDNKEDFSRTTSRINLPNEFQNDYYINGTEFSKGKSTVTNYTNNNTDRTHSDNDYSNNSSDDEISICDMYHDSSFYKLWKKVVFYKFFLHSSFARDLCASLNPNESLDICAMKLRDLTVMWCLQIYGILEKNMNILIKNRNLIDIEILKHCQNLENIIIKEIFNNFIIFAAPPQLIILKTFPKKIAHLVSELTGQEHKCIDNQYNDELIIYSIKPDLIKKWCIPYITDIRRQFKNLLLREQNKLQNDIYWNFAQRHIMQDLDFFLLDQHATITIKEMLTLTDTVLFRLYLDYIPPMVGPLIRVDNMCDADIVIKDLRENSRFQDLVDFYNQKKMHKEALLFLTDLNNQMDKDENNDKLKLLKDNIFILVLEYLKKLPNQYLELIFEYTVWLLKNDDDDQKKYILVSLFLSDTQVALSRDHLKVYEFINKYDQTISLDYLEYIFNDIGNAEDEIIIILVERYLASLNIENSRKKLKFLLHKTDRAPLKIIKLLEAELNKEDGLSKENINFVRFLQTFPLSKIGNHEKSIEILFNELKDYKKSSNYCNDVYSSNSEEGSKILLYLLKKILATSEDENCGQLIDFLQDHIFQLDIKDVLNSLPNGISLKKVKQHIFQLLKLQVSKKNNVRLEKEILEVELVNTTNALYKNSSEFITLNEKYKCRICNKNFISLTTDMVLWITMKNGKDYLVHYHCGKLLEQKMHENDSQKIHFNKPMNLTEAKSLISKE